MYDKQFQGFKVYNYLRRSEREGSWKQERSIQDQEADNIAFAERLGLEIVETIVEKDSAWKPNNRPKFKKMLKELSYKTPERRKAEGILAWHPNRLSRNAQEAGVVVQMLDDELIKNLFFPSYSFHNDTSWKEHLTIEFARAKGYSDQLSDVVCRGVHGREKEGAMIYSMKFWYKKRREFSNPKKSTLFPIPEPEQFDMMKRCFQLAKEGNSTKIILARLKDEYWNSWLPIPSLTRLDKRLRDSFYCGLWVIKPWSKKERTINLLEMELPDGTRFEPVLSIEDFDLIQKIRSGNITRPNMPRKRINPLPNMVSCSSCGKRMYASYRKIKRAGWVRKEQLGYECQTKSLEEKCPQSRIKATVLFEYIENELPRRSQSISKKEYQMYVLAVHLFLKKKREFWKSQKAKITRSLQRAKKDKQKLIFQRADLISAKSYDKDSQEHFESRIQELSETIESLSIEKSELGKDNTQKTVSFVHFLELIENLHQYWISANLKQKGQISKNLLLNLCISGQAVRSANWLKPFWEGQNDVFFTNGADGDKALERYFERVWDRCFFECNADIRQKLSILTLELWNSIEPIYSIVKDIAKITRT